MISVQVHNSVEGMRRLAPHWRLLEQRCPEPFTYFQTYDWCTAWLEQCCSPTAGSIQPHIVTIWRDGCLAALWPGMVTGSLTGTRTISVLGTPHTQYATALYDPDLLDHQAERALGEAMRQAGSADVVSVQAIPEGSLLARLLENVRCPTTQNSTAILDLGAYTSWDHYLSTLSGDHRRKRNQRRNKLGKCGEVTFRATFPGEPGYRQLLGTCLSWKRQWLAETGRYSAGLSIGGHEDFLASLPGAHDSLQGALLFALEVSGRPVAIEFGFLHRKSYYAYLGSFDWDYRDYSPGKIAMEMCQRWLIEAGVESYDLLANPAEYKATWSNRTVPLVSASQSSTLRGHLAGKVWDRQVKPGLKRLYGALPQGLRRAVLTRTLGLTFSTALLLEAA